MARIKLTFQQIVENKNFTMYGRVKDKNIRIICNDGESLSIQAHKEAYCTPRANKGPYTHLEVGYPSVKPPDSMMEFCEDSDKPTDTVYAYVPVTVIQEFIDLHGGEKE